MLNFVVDQQIICLLTGLIRNMTLFSPQIGGWKLSKSVSGYLHADVHPKKSDDALTSLSIAYPSVSESGNQWEKKYIDKLE